VAGLVKSHGLKFQVENVVLVLAGMKKEKHVSNSSQARIATSSPLHRESKSDSTSLEIAATLQLDLRTLQSAAYCADSSFRRADRWQVAIDRGPPHPNGTRHRSRASGIGHRPALRVSIPCICCCAISGLSSPDLQLFIFIRRISPKWHLKRGIEDFLIVGIARL